MQVLLEDNMNFGYNAAKDCYEDLMKARIMDPTKVWSFKYLLHMEILHSQIYEINACVKVKLDYHNKISILIREKYKKKNKFIFTKFTKIYCCL